MVKGALTCLLVLLAFMSYAGTTSNIRYLAIGDLPLDGGFVPGVGLVSSPIAGENDSAEVRAEKLRKAWNVAQLPAITRGVALDGNPTSVRIDGIKHNEFGAQWVRDSESEDVLFYWSGELSLVVLPPEPVKVSAKDRGVLLRACKDRGVELKHHLDDPSIKGSGTIWYLDPLNYEDRQDILDPTKDENIKLVVVSPRGFPQIGLAGCWYHGKSAGQLYRGPVLAYDFVGRVIRWSDAVDLDEHQTFLRFEQDIYLVEFTYCDACETSGWNVSLFAKGNRGSKVGYSISERLASCISGSQSWFFSE